MVHLEIFWKDDSIKPKEPKNEKSMNIFSDWGVVTISNENSMTPFLGWFGFLYRIWHRKLFFSNDELHTILKRRNLEIGEHSSFWLIIEWETA